MLTCGACQWEATKEMPQKVNAQSDSMVKLTTQSIVTLSSQALVRQRRSRFCERVDQTHASTTLYAIQHATAA